MDPMFTIALLLGALGTTGTTPAAQDAPPVQPPVREEPTSNPQATGLDIAAGYAAKVTASCLFVAGRSLESVRSGELFPVLAVEKAAFPLIELTVDRDARSVTAQLPGGRPVTAVHREGLGCVLAIGEDAASLRAEALPARGQAGDPASTSSPASPLAPAPPLPAEQRNALDAAISRAMSDGAQPGFQPTRAILILKDGEIAAERYAPGFDQGSRLAGWSMAKSLTGLLVLLRWHELGLDLDGPLDPPGWAKDTDPRAAVTVRSLLRMSSGLAFDEDYADLTSDATRMLFGSRSASAVALDQPLAAPVGTRWEYSSGTTNILQGALRATFEARDDYWAWPRRALLDPAGMRSAILETDASGTFVGSSFAWMTARDWGRLGQLILDGGVVQGHTGPVQVVPEGVIADLIAPAPAARTGNYASQVWLNRGPDEAPERRSFPELPRDLIYLSGYEGQYVLIFPEASLVVVRLGVSKGYTLPGVQRLCLEALKTFGDGRQR